MKYVTRIAIDSATTAHNTSLLCLANQSSDARCGGRVEGGCVVFDRRLALRFRDIAIDFLIC